MAPYVAGVILTIAAGVLAAPAPAPAPAPSLSAPARGVWLGVLLGDAVDGGVQILDVVPGGPASRGGLEAGDVLIRVDDTEVSDRDSLRGAVRRLSAGQTVKLTLFRAGQKRVATIEVGGSPSAEDRATIQVNGAAGALGLTTEQIPGELRVYLGGPPDAGVLVTRVDALGKAAGRLVAGDLLVRVNGVRVVAPDDLAAYLDAHQDRAVACQGIRAGKSFTVNLPALAGGPDDGSRARRIHELDSAIRQLEGTLAGLKQERAALAAGHP